MQSGDPISPNPQMESHMMRLATFRNLPESASLSPAMASKAGFYYTGPGDSVACYSCGLRLNHWQSGVQPMPVHRRLSPECQLVVTLQSRSVPMEVDTTQVNRAPVQVSQAAASTRAPERMSMSEMSNAGSRAPVQVTSADRVSQEVLANAVPEEVHSQSRSRRRGPRRRPNSNNRQPHYLSMLASVAGGGNWSAYVDTGQSSSRTSSQRRDTVDSITDMQMISDDFGIADFPDLSGATNIGFADMVDSPARFTERVNNNDPTLLVEMKYERRRLATYSDWPRDVVDIAPEALAQAGLFYLGLADRVKCAFCGGILRNWEPLDEPAREHLRNFPHCQFLRDPRAAGNVAIGEEPPLTQVLNVATSTTSRATIADELGIQMGQPRHPSMRVESTRMASLDAWPRSSPVSPDSLAHAGFFYTGDTDTVYCFFCDGHLNNWQRGDDPMTEHRRHFPQCGFVRLSENEPTSQTSTSTDTASGTSAAAATVTTAAAAAAPAAAVTPENTDTGAASERPSMICKVCLDADMNTVILPCGHLACCANCASALSTCPICRHRIEGRVRTFMS